MSGLSSLAKDTAIYGLSSIVGRFLNYLLVPLYTAKLSAASGGYGVITNVYAYTALLLVILTYGMETTFFRFANKEGENPQKVYSTTLTAVGLTSLLFVAAVLAFIGPISGAMGYADHPSYVWVMAIAVALDAFQCIPFALNAELQHIHERRRHVFAILEFFGFPHICGAFAHPDHAPDDTLPQLQVVHAVCVFLTTIHSFWSVIYYDPIHAERTDRDSGWI